MSTATDVCVFAEDEAEDEDVWGTFRGGFFPPGVIWKPESPLQKPSTLLPFPAVGEDDE
jgi:hypothetical protein